MAKPKKIKVTELKNMARILAEAAIKQHGEYRCLINGKQVVVYK